MAYTFADAKAKGRRTTQFFDIMGSRGIYHDGWFACTFGPRTPWVPGLPKGIAEWSPEKDMWELYNLDEDWSQADDLAAKMPEKLAEMKNLFLVESTKNKNLPIGGGLWTLVLHPEDGPATPYTEWTFSGPITRMPEFAAPKLGKFDNTVSMDVDVPANANGVLYALGGFSGGLTCLREGRRALLRIQPVRDPAHADQGEGQAAGRQGEDRGRVADWPRPDPGLRWTSP